jgi:hypothetical protein
LPPGPLLLEADFAATADAPLTAVGERLREALFTAAERGPGLRVTRVDLRVTDLLESPAPRVGEAPGHDGTGGLADQTGPGQARQHREEEHPPAPADRPPQAIATAEAVIAVPGVARLAPVLGPAPGGLPADAVTLVEREGGRHLRTQIAVAEGSRALDVARAVRRAAVKAAAWDAPEPTPPVTVAVLVTAVDPVTGSGGERTGRESVQAG